jgi:hypothetical protein
MIILAVLVSTDSELLSIVVCLVTNLVLVITAYFDWSFFSDE